MGGTGVWVAALRDALWQLDAAIANAIVRRSESPFHLLSVPDERWRCEPPISSKTHPTLAEEYL